MERNKHIGVPLRKVEEVAEIPLSRRLMMVMLVSYTMVVKRIARFPYNYITVLRGIEEGVVHD